MQSTTTSITPAQEEGWRYWTYYLYPLTRHTSESEIDPEYWVYPLYPFFVLIDTAVLPFAAIAGLFGDGT